MKIDKLLTAMEKMQASDLFLHTDKPPAMRIKGDGVSRSDGARGEATSRHGGVRVQGVIPTRGGDVGRAEQRSLS